MKAIAQAGKSYLFREDGMVEGTAVLVAFPGQNKGVVNIDAAYKFGAWGPVMTYPSSTLVELAKTLPEQKDVYGGMSGIGVSPAGLDGLPRKFPNKKGKKKKSRHDCLTRPQRRTIREGVLGKGYSLFDRAMSIETKVKDGDGDGLIYDGTALEQPAPPGTSVLGDLVTAKPSLNFGKDYHGVADKHGNVYIVGPDPEDPGYIAIGDTDDPDTAWDDLAVEQAATKREAIELLDARTRQNRKRGDRSVHGSLSKTPTKINMPKRSSTDRERDAESTRAAQKAALAKKVGSATAKAAAVKKKDRTDTPASKKTGAPKTAAAKKRASAKKRADAVVKKTRVFTDQAGLPLTPTGKRTPRYKALKKPKSVAMPKTRKASTADIQALNDRGIKIQPAHENIRVPTAPQSGFGSFDYMYDHHRIKDGVIKPDQKRYSQEHDNYGQQEKFKRVANMADHIGELDDQIRKSADKDDTWGAIALMRILAMRPSNDDGETLVRNAQGGYDPVKTYGATTLLRDHVTDNGDGSVTISLTGKAAHQISIKTDDPVIVSLITKRLKKRGKGTDPLFDTSAAETNEAIKTIFPDMGNKDLRTYVATAMAIREVEAMPVPRTLAEFKAAVKEVTTITANQLQHGQTMSLASYVAPAVFYDWAMAAGVDYDAFENPIKGRTRRMIEKGA